MPIMEQFVFKIIGALIYFIKIMNKVCMGSLWDVDAHHNLDVLIWNSFECILEMEKEYAI